MDGPRTLVASTAFVAALLFGVGFGVGCSDDGPDLEEPNTSGSATGGSGDVVNGGGDGMDPQDGGSTGTSDSGGSTEDGGGETTGEGDGGGATGDVDDGGSTGGVDDGGTTGDDDGTTDDGGGTTDDGGSGEIEVCKRECGSASDCARSGGSEENWACMGGTCEPEFCTMDAECTPFLSGWRDEGCTAQDGCFGGYTCVEHGDTTWCANEPMDGSCAEDFSKLQKTPAGGGEDVTVCGVEAMCDDGLCLPATDEPLCETDSDCAGGGSCSSSVGRCTCFSGDCNDGWTCEDE